MMRSLRPTSEANLLYSSSHSSLASSKSTTRLYFSASTFAKTGFWQLDGGNTR
eukprot:CAMPEP_0180038228 /NCGR_PEP_ID=MMETSP0984-20121128/32052_1 /TAXON_ID=483367 /ORGANISM="non described non described, Strain CCMP 2436" /LENGTH=52 /DNA_ID=CAMNT_0021964863 /DNA_START=303 /DNA_END=461 /DNA_ORIENTATION=-